ncbi:mitochondrial Oxa1p [Blastomyces dermatitidis ER-3]|uniref:Mitochondrial Oxa1p n=2 Tax=Ajellomyces dermatitidis TaxID=5039 RepID=F2TFQ8_AJEDA|nr:mitochondrial Oxa1p [Blastomyces dermatitidis ER-3]EEQ89249.1 mitochondrial Oxa1p [Blastomyces dermatitidis ER-3]EGE82071.1 mitochondrial Oxa1p [Blastomyces dermatitidis ATCC 18188]EQL33394.1 hypothetical protein BDFG_04547 [Blastomyces dermatitidis ATCC 26199]
MLVKAAVRPWAAVPGGTRRTLVFSPHSSRSLSTITAKKSFQLRSRTSTQNASGLISTSWSPGLLPAAGASSSRFNSTAASPSPAAEPAASVAIDSTVNAPVSSGAQAIDSLSAADLVSVDISQIPEKLGYLKAIGLDYGWGPSRVIETVLESLHIYGGLPWWGAAIGTSVLLRLFVLKFAMGASDTSAKVASIKHITQPFQVEIQRCYRENDTVGLQRVLQQRKIINESHDIKLRRLAYPLVQLPLSFGAFRVLRGMSALPVPGLDSESFLWLSNVTVHDPYFILPITTGLIMHYTFKLGGENAGANDPTAMMAKPILLYGLPILSTVCTSFLPGILQIFFATTSVLAIGQSYAFRHPSIRAMTGMAPFPSPAVIDTTASEPKARILEVQTNNPEQAPDQVETVPKVSFIDRFITSFQRSVSSTRKKMESYTGQNEKVETFADGTPKSRLTKKQLEDAIAYENRRREELSIERETRNKERQMEYRRKLAEKKRKQREL